MGQVEHDEVKLMLLALGGQELKRLLRGVSVVVSSYSREVEATPLPGYIAGPIAERMALMNSFARGFSTNLDEILGLLGTASPAVGQVEGLVTSFETGYAASMPELGGAHERWRQDLSALPPHVWDV